MPYFTAAFAHRIISSHLQRARNGEEESMNGPALAAVRIGSRVAPLCERWDGAVSVLDRGFGPLVDLAIRLWLAQIFFVSGVLKTSNWDVTVFLYTNEHPVPGLDPATAAVIGTGIELICPILLAFGLAGRIAAAASKLAVGLVLFREG
jgi:DoxX-like protein